MHLRQLPQRDRGSIGGRLGGIEAVSMSKGRSKRPSRTAEDAPAEGALALTTSPRKRFPPAALPCACPSPEHGASAMKRPLRPMVPSPAATASAFSGNLEFEKRCQRFGGKRGMPAAAISAAVAAAHAASRAPISPYQLPRANRPIVATGFPGSGSGRGGSPRPARAAAGSGATSGA
jgi:hypothetical protein